MANVKQTDILTGSIPRQLLAFFLPIWFGTLFQQLYNTADTLIVGNFVGTRALAAVGATGAFVNLLVGLFVGLCSGVGVVVSQSFGARDYDGVDRQVHTALVFSVVIGAVLTLAGLVTAQPMMRLMGTPDEILDASTLYLRIYFLGMIPQILYNTGTYILRAIGDSKRPLYFLIAASLVNIVLDVVFIAVLGWGVAGAAIATVVSQWPAPCSPCAASSAPRACPGMSRWTKCGWSRASWGPSAPSASRRRPKAPCTTSATWSSKAA